MGYLNTVIVFPLFQTCRLLDQVSRADEQTNDLLLIVSAVNMECFWVECLQLYHESNIFSTIVLL